MTTDENLSMTPDNDKAPQRRKRPRKGPIVGILLLLFLLAGIGAGAWWYLFLRFEESTDDAYVAGNVLRIMPQVSGKVVAVDVDDNDMVAAGQTLVRLDPVDARLAYERSLVALASAVRDNCRLQAQLRETEAAIRMRRVDLRQKADNLTRREALARMPPWRSPPPKRNATRLPPCCWIPGSPSSPPCARPPPTCATAGSRSSAPPS